MPTFTPGQSVTARATLPVKPAGLACRAELYLGTGKVATSGKVPFTSTGADQQITLPITMPSSGSYQVLLDITTDSLLIGAFIGTEVVNVTLPSFTIGSLNLFDYACPDAIAWGTIDFTCKITNNTGMPGSHTYRLRDRRYSLTYGVWYGPYTHSSFLVTLNPGQSYSYSFKGYRELQPGSWGCDPSLGRNYEYHFYIEDEVGHKSAEIVVIR